MKHLLSIVSVLFLVSLIHTVSYADEQKEEAVLESISFERDENNRETIIFKLNGTHIPKIFKIKGEKPRLVFDFIDTRYSDLINRVIDTKGSLVKGVRVGVHNNPPKTRVVVDLKPEGKYDFEQDFLVQEKVLSITFFPDDTKKMINATKDIKEAPALTPAKPQLEQQRDTVVAETAIAPIPRPDAEPTILPPASTENTMQSKPAEDESTAKVETSKPEAEPVNPLLAQSEEVEPVSADPILRDVSFESTANNGEMVLFKLNDFYPPIVFGIEKGNPRVVCDFLDTDLDKEVRPVIETRGNYVSRVRTARHKSPDKVRVVLDLVPNRNYDLQQVFFKEDNLFVIIINEFEEEPVPAMDISSEPALNR